MGDPVIAPQGFSIKGLDVAPQGFSPLPPQGIQQEPIPQPQLNLETTGRRIAPDLGPIEQAAIPDVIRKAADAGVLFDNPAPRGQFLSSLAFDEKNARRALERELGTSVRMGPKTGALEFFDKEKNRFSLVSPPGELGSAGSLGGPLMKFAPEVAGGSIATIFTRSPVATEVAAGTGAGLGEIVRLKLGQTLGINEDVSDSDIILSGAKEAGIAIVSGVALNKFVKMGKFITDIASGRAFTQRTLDQLNIDINQAQEIADTINDTLGAEKFRVNLAQATNDDELLNTQEFFKRSKEFGPQFGAFADEQQQALKDFSEAINKPYRSRLSTEGVGQRVVDLAEDQIDAAVRHRDVFVAMKDAELQDALSSLKGRPPISVGQTIRDVGDAEQTGFREWADTAADELNNLAGGDSFISNKATHEAVTKLDSQIRDALFPKLEQATRNILGEAAAEPVDEAVQEVTSSIFDPNAKFSFRQAWRAISALRRTASVASKGLSTEDPSVGALNLLANSLEKDMFDGMEGSPLREQFQQFIKRYRAEKLRLDSGTVAQVMRREGGKNGRFVVADENVFRTIFRPGGVREAREVKSLIDGDPQAMTAMRESIVDFYKGEVLDGGRVNINAHKQFLRNYIGPIRQFFNKQEVNQFISPGQIEKALQSREAARKLAVQNINKTFKSRLANVESPGAIFNLVFDPKRPDRMRELVGMLGKTPVVLRGVQN